MVQEFHVLRCFSCQSFQVQQVKKANRWSCKLCGEKQSILKEFGRGSAADCRRHVQKLNAMRGAMMEEQEHNSLSLWKQVEADGEDEAQEQRNDQVTPTRASCWSKYLDTPEEAEQQEEEEQDVLIDVQQLHGNQMIDRKRKRSEGRTDSGGQDNWTPEQTQNFSLKKRPVRPADSTTCLNRTTAPSLNRTTAPSLNRTTAPSLNRTTAPSLNTTAPSLNRTTAPSLNRTTAPSLNRTTAPSLNRTTAPSLNRTRTPSLNRTRTPSLKSCSVRRWGRFVGSDCQVNEGKEETLVSGRSQSVGGVMSCHGTAPQTPPLTKPRPLLPVSSMFQSGDEFNFDDEFLSAD